MPPDPGVATGTLRPPVSTPIGRGEGSDYGNRPPPAPGASTFHPGVDYPVPTGTPIRAADGGRVIFAGRAGTAGNVTVIDHGNGLSTRYLHQNQMDVRVGDPVAQGQVIGQSGNTGIGTGPHLHFELRSGGTSAFRSRDGSQSIDPEPLFGRSYTGQTRGQAAPSAPSPSASRTATPAAGADGVLRMGERGPEVTDLQRRLVALGYPLGPSGPARNGVDGAFGESTRRAVQAFQRDRGLSEAQQQGNYGPVTRAQVQAAERDGWRRPAEPQATRTAPVTTPTATAPAATAPTAPVATIANRGTALNTAGPFAAVSTGALIGTRQGTSLGALTADQSYALGRAVFGDGPGAAALQRVDQQLGAGRGVFVQRMIALGQHEGSLNFGRRNADPASGSNIGTFQVGGAGTTAAQTQVRYDALLARGIREVEALGGPRADARTLSPADRDIFAHIGHMTDRAANVYRRPADDLLRQMSNPDVRGEDLVTLVHNRVQGGIRDIGTDVVRMTDREQGVQVNLAAVEARGREPDALRREPAMPILDRRLSQSYSPAVEAWQGVLAARGLPTSASAPNGVYNSATRESTQALQREAGLTADGTVGPATWSRFSTVGARTVDGSPAPNPPAPGRTTPAQTVPAQTAPAQTVPGATRPESGHSGITQTLRQGATGPEVVILQQQLKALGYPLGTTCAARDGVDGQFGARTRDGVEAFQRDRGLAADGVVGRDTRGALPVYVRDEPRTQASPAAPTQTAHAGSAPAAVPTPSQTFAPASKGPLAAPAYATAAAAFLREADQAVSNVLDRHVSDVPGALAALVRDTRGPGSGTLGATTAQDVQRSFERFTAGDATARPLSATEAGMVASVLDERARLVGEGTTPPAATTGDGAGATPPAVSPARPAVDTAPRL